MSAHPRQRLLAPIAGLFALCLMAGACSASTEVEEPGSAQLAAESPTVVAAEPAEAPIELVDPTPEPVVAATPTPTPAPSAEPAPAVTPTPVSQPGVVETWVPEVLDSFPHDPAAFTQGFELVDPTTAVESTGLRGESSLRRVDLTTGQVLQQVDVDDELFGEGLTQVGDRLIQLTWTSGVSLWYDATTFELVNEIDYDGEGWGLCFDGARLVMSDGSDVLTFRDPQTFEPTGEIAVTLDGQPIGRLNELECVDGKVWANVWQTPIVLRIEPSTGVVEVVVDASSLVSQRTEAEGVLNGLAFDAASQTWLMTGKRWNTVYRVQFVSDT